MSKKRNKKITLVSWVVIFVLLWGEFVPISVWAASLTTSTSLLGDVTFPINSSDNQTMGIGNKENGPTVDVIFDSSGTSITQGVKITANVIPGYFKDDSSELYYTWYLKRKGCDLDGEATSRCDLDSDGKITVNDWKVAAAQIIIKGSYDNVDEKYTTTVDSKISGYEAYPSPIRGKEWLMNSGAEINDKDAPNCYVQEPKSGLIYEMRRVDQEIQGCPEGYQRVCAASAQTATCEVLNPLYDATAATEQGDSYAIPKMINKTTDKFCAITNDAPVDVSDIYCEITDLENYQQEPRCYDNAVAMCVKYSTNPSVSGNVVFPDNNPATTPLLAAIFKKNNVCSSFSVNNSAPPAWLSTQNAIYDNVKNQTCLTAENILANGEGDNSGDSNTVLKCSSEKAGNVCKHLFAKEPRDVGIIGDGKFTLAEKRFWGANPSVSSTNGVNLDEASIVGLGTDKFTWMYNEGDQVGVAVEGDSAFSTNHADSSYKRMWAFSKNTCKALEDLATMNTATADKNDGVKNKNRRNMYLEGPGGGDCDLNDKSDCVGFLTAEVNLDDCLEENLIDPVVDVNTGVSSKLSLQLVSSPANPINDPSGKGDVLEVSAAGLNAQETENMSYNWTVQISRDGSTPPIDTTIWKDITSGLEQNASFSSFDVKGINKKKLNINLNLSDEFIKNNIGGTYSGVFYLKIKAKTQGTTTDGSQNAEGFIIVKVRQQQNEIKMYSVTANNTGMLFMDENGEELCSSDTEKDMCWVAKNEIIGLVVPSSGDTELTNFSWKVNGVDIVCNGSISTQCSAEAGNKIFIPILGNTEESVLVSAGAINVKTNEAVKITRNFVITKPQIKISSADESSVWPKLLGYYKDLNGNKYPDYSDVVFEAPRGGNASLVATSYPNFSGNQSEIQWAIDGEIQYDLNGKREITLPINKSEGESYDVGILISHKNEFDAQNNNIRKALLKNWRVAIENIFDENQDVNIQINVLAAGSQKITSKNVQGGLASLISHLPENLIFLFKIILTSGALLLLTGIVFAVMPETPFKKE